MVQLNNENKGKTMPVETPLDPVRQAFENQLIESPTVKKLHEADREIIGDLEGLKGGQSSLAKFVSEGFAKGKDRMDGLEVMFKNHITTTQDNHKEAMGAISNLNIEIKDNKIKDVVQESTKRNEEFKAYKEKVWSVVKTVVIGIFMLVAGGFIGKWFV